MTTFVLFCFVFLCWSPMLLFAIGLINWYSHRNDSVKNSANALCQKGGYAR